MLIRRRTSHVTARARIHARYRRGVPWQQLDEFWEVLRRKADAGWHIYAIGTPVPTQISSGADVVKFVNEVGALLRKEHYEDYCGIVYTDSKQDPTLVKIFDPDNLGVSCGFNNNPPLPGWILSRIPPAVLPMPVARPRRGLRSLFGGGS